MASFLEDFQARNRSARQEMIDHEVYKVKGADIAKTASAMLEAKVKREKIIDKIEKAYENYSEMVCQRNIMEKEMQN